MRGPAPYEFREMLARAGWVPGFDGREFFVDEGCQLACDMSLDVGFADKGQEFAGVVVVVAADFGLDWMAGGRRHVDRTWLCRGANRKARRHI